MAPAALVTPALGLLVGLVLALTGAGGAILAVPLLVFGLHLSMAQAGPIGLTAVALAATLGAVLGLRGRVLRYKAAGLMALAGAATSPLGLWFAQRLPNRPLTAVFALVLAAVGWRMLVQASREMRGEPHATAQSPPCRLNRMLGKLQWNAACARALVLAGAAAGFLSGLLGVGGGFIVVPTLLSVSDLPMKAVIATSMGVLALVSAVGVVNAGVAGYLSWHLAWPFAAGALAGLLVGRIFAARLAGPRLQQCFALLSLGVACSLLARITV
jgi:uncharacterized protein